MLHQNVDTAPKGNVNDFKTLKDFTEHMSQYGEMSHRMAKGDKQYLDMVKSLIVTEIQRIDEAKVHTVHANRYRAALQQAVEVLDNFWTSAEQMKQKIAQKSG